MYDEHPNERLTEIKSCNIDFIENDFLSIGEVKKSLELYELQKEAIQSLNKGRELQAHFEIANDSRRDLPPSGNMPLDDFSQGLELCKSKQSQISHLHF